MDANVDDPILRIRLIDALWQSPRATPRGSRTRKNADIDLILSSGPTVVLFVVSGGHVLICTEQDEDVLAVHAVNVSAFETSAEANLVDALREQANPVVSLVAEESGTVVGHILFSPVTLSGCPDMMLMGLAPMAVRPEHQRQGIGSELVRTGLKRCRQLDCVAVIVLGHPKFYPRFGFSPASRFGIDSEYDVPDETFMAVELVPNALSDKHGQVQYHAAFSNL